MKIIVKNDKGEEVLLNEQEQLVSETGQKMVNALGYGDISITTLTAISKRIVDQKFFTVPPALYMPVKVGQNAWSTEILSLVSQSLAGDFEAGIINTGANNPRLASADAGLDTLRVPVKTWAKEITWSLPELRFAQKAGNWDVVSRKEASRKKNWDLGIQKIAFLGLASDASVRGLLTQTNVTSNTTLILKTISSMNETEFATFIAGLLQAYRVNVNYTAWPTHFIIPEADYNGLAVAVSENFGLVSKLERMRKAFAEITMNPNFKILPLAYASQANNATVSGLNKNRYTLLNFDEESLAMEIPVDYTNTVQGTVNGFNWQNVGYGQFSGVLAYRPREMLYFDWS